MNRKKILIIDDNPDDQKLVSHYLDNSYGLDYANTGLEGIEKALLVKPDLILIDIGLPRMDGYTVCKNLKSNSKTANIPVVFITSSSTDADERKAFDVGAVEFISKSTLPEIIRLRIESVLRFAKSNYYSTDKNNIHLIDQILNRIQRKNEKLDKSSQSFEELKEELSIFQEELLAQNDELENQYNRNTEISAELETIFNVAPAGIVEINQDHKIVKINHLALNYLPYAKINDLIWPKILSNFNTEKFLDWLSNRDTSPIQINSKEKPEFWVTVTKSYTDVKTILLLFTDISELKKTQQELLESTKKAMEANAESLAKSEFLAKMSHELRTPLHAITNFSSMIPRKVDSNETVIKFSGYIYQSSVRLSKLVDNILDLSRFQLKKKNMELEKIEITELTRDVVEIIKRSSDTKNISFNINSVNNVFARIDRKLFAQLVENLVENAIKFSTDGQNIDIDIQQKNDADNGLKQEALHFSVVDEGIGIPNEELVSVFEHFKESSRTSSQAAGTGLGLAICKEIVDLHQGKIWAQSPPDGESSGTVVKFVLPIITE